MLSKLSFVSLTLTTLVALFVSGCGSGGGDRAGIGRIYSISGTVTDTTNNANKPLANISISISGPGGFKDVIATDMNGNYSFKNLANAQYTVAPPEGGVYTFVPSILTPNVSGNDVGNQDFRASSSVTLLGIVTGPLARVNGVKITLNDGTSTTTIQGAYSFTDKAKGTYKATPTYPGYLFSPAESVPVTINGGAASFNPFLSAIDPATTRNITGSAVLQGVTISLTGGPATPPITTNTYGNYSFTGLADGSYTVTPTKAGFTFTPRSSLLTVNGTSVITGPGFIAAGKLNDTGMTTSECYTISPVDTLVSCSTADISLGKTQDGMVGRDVTAHVSGYGRLGFNFTSVNNLACVQDNVTGLMWENKTIANSATQYTNFKNLAVNDASSFVASANSTSLCGFTGWRLPTPSELLSIMDFGMVSGPGLALIDTNWFPNTPTTRDKFYWSSSEVFNSAGSVWFVDFSSGLANSNSSARTYYVRLVRTGQ